MCVLTNILGGGYWQPDAAALAKLRRDIDRKPHKLKAVLRSRAIRDSFLAGVKDDDNKAVKAFTSLPMNKSTALKRNPKVSTHLHCAGRVCCLLGARRRREKKKQVSMLV